MQNDAHSKFLPKSSEANRAPGGLPSGPKPSRGTPPDSIPDLMPGVDPQQTPGIDHLPAERF